jgi:hypothetical protein
MKLRYFQQDERTYLAVERDVDDEDYCLVIEVERMSRNGRHRWEAVGNRRPVQSFVDLPRVSSLDVPKFAMIAARTKYSEF